MKQQERKQLLLENLIFIIIWSIVLIAPFFRQNQENTTDWEYITLYWKMVAPFFVLFILHNYLLLPCLFLRKRYWPYVISVPLLIYLLFSLKPFILNKGHFSPPLQHTEQAGPRFPKEPLTPGSNESHQQHKPFHDEFFPPEQGDNKRADHIKPQFRKPENVRRKPIGMAPVLNDWLIAILIIGFNVAIKLLFKSIRDDRQLKELEKHTLQTELDYLKAQINPHFFMNTLNNIHALVDLDTEKAKYTVLELSKIMRYVLYEANQTKVPLSKEVDFLQHYIELMRIRYPEEVDIRFGLPEQITDIRIPPLLLITFVENAFKHGVSYQHPSFIHIHLNIEKDTLSFSVSNSLFEKKESTDGVGLENVRKRLNLLYKAKYKLETSTENDTYRIELILPIEL